MNESPFAAGTPMWSGTPPVGFGWPGGLGPMSFGSRMVNVGPLGFSSPQFPQTGPIGTNVPGQQIVNAVTPDPYGLGSPMNFPQQTQFLPQQIPFGAGFNSGLPLGPTPFGTPAAFPSYVNQELVTAYGTPALLAAVAIRRGQPMGPSNDQECEDFIYDALELLPGTSEVEVRCESGRVTLTGSVHHKRLKRDVGEIGWAIPSVSDVQNNVTISTKRRSRGSARESEPHGTGSRKQS
ncbi:MAG: hypothetical protein DMG04_22275 [Acidobacteria bacterium]|nr:MAG: hypothetical protein DMG04_22275 [Acidobacteriota bacterium]PYQ90436.1 MAG: hypothetical protein DMG03_00680 [Acidobacteriota bacterium]PYQ91509.1 MAG: hypothetical protein DMG02_05870 [Acidobacteriota bacterium]PYR04839.1 MAG: hypothetical protein DMF99_30655 [Acidobacteriota bacterium]